MSGATLLCTARPLRALDMNLWRAINDVEVAVQESLPSDPLEILSPDGVQPSRGSERILKRGDRGPQFLNLGRGDGQINDLAACGFAEAS